MGVVEVDTPIEKIPTDGPGAPLKPRTVRKWLSVDWADPKQELTATIPLVTGMGRREARHLNPSWISESDGNIHIHVPLRARCIYDTCQNCRVYHDGYFGNRWRSRDLPVYDDRVADVLRAYDPLGGQLVARRVNIMMEILGEGIDIDRDITCRALKHTFGVALGAKGCTRREIYRWTGNDPDVDYGRMKTAKDYQNISETSPWDELAALGNGEFRPV